jgi:hypothetical protein
MFDASIRLEQLSNTMKYVNKFNHPWNETAGLVCRSVGPEQTDGPRLGSTAVNRQIMNVRYQSQATSLCVYVTTASHSPSSFLNCKLAELETRMKFKVTALYCCSRKVHSPCDCIQGCLSLESARAG